jgi:hypothetical protein
MNRVLEPELLDELPSTDPRAVQSRRDLRKLNALMTNPRRIARFVASTVKANSISIAEIGAGDGNVALQVANHCGRCSDLYLVDRNPCVSRPMPNVHVVEADVFEWLKRAPKIDVIIANLFLHHFSDDALREMFELCASRANCFVAAEPRRNRFAEWFARRVGWIGCNEVTQHDADISVRAGFTGRELSALWPRDDWRLNEHRACLFTHFFTAIRA